MTRSAADQECREQQRLSRDPGDPPATPTLASVAMHGGQGKATSACVSCSCERGEHRARFGGVRVIYLGLAVLAVLVAAATGAARSAPAFHAQRARAASPP